jgi:hypothetical protein
MCNSFATFACGAIKNRMFVYEVFAKRVPVKFQPLVKKTQRWLTGLELYLGWGVELQQGRKKILWTISNKRRRSVSFITHDKAIN